MTEMKVVTLKLPADIVARLDAAGGNRSENIRAAISSWLDKPAPKIDKKPERLSPTHRPAVGSEEIQAITTALMEHRYSTRQLAQHLGWNEMRVNKIIERMERAKMVRFERGTVILA